MSGPDIAVAIASHERPLRLRWLLNALEEQTLDRARFEVAVCHDSTGPETERLLREHPLGVTALRLAAGRNPPGAQRNRAWRATSAPLVVFTDDDCRPPSDWLERALAAARANPGCVVQGRTAPDPDELGLLHAAAHTHTQIVDPPVAWAQTCNIIYPRAVLEALGGFDERFEGGEDTDLACRALAGGAPLAGAPDVLTYHAVEPRTLPAAVRAAWRWRHLPELIARHPQLRGNASVGRVFWKRSHLLLLLGAAATPAVGPLALVPWMANRLPSYGRSPRGSARAVAELPGQAIVDLTEIAALGVGSMRARSLFI